MSAVIALSDFFINNFPNISWYPYWYLGNPFQYLIGPVVPSFLFLFKIFPWSTTVSYYLLILAGFFIGAGGLYFLIKNLGGQKRDSLYSSVLFLILPFSLLLLQFQNGLHHIVFGFLPWILLLFSSLCKKPSSKNALFLSIAIAFVILIDVSILLPILVGFVVLFLVFKPQKKEAEYKTIYTLFILLFALSLSTLWYTPSFWWMLLSSPSFGGMPLLKLVQFLFQLLLQVLPIILAVSVVKWRHLKPSKPLLFGILFFSSFFFLTIIRFLSDPNFVMDWIGFLLELQFGGAIILGSSVQSANWRTKFKIFNLKLQLFTFNFSLLTLLIIGSSIVFDFLISSSIINQTRNDYQKRIVSMLKEIPKDERVFLSGSPVFFANSFLNIAQVRGGMDQASVHPWWAHGAYQIREGQDSDLTRNWLVALGALYVLVQNKGSEEPFHDFKHPEKFRNFELVSQNGGDFLYKVPKADLARVVDATILKVHSPRNGADQNSLSAYVKTIKHPISSFFEKPNKILVNGKIGKNELISLAVSYDPKWNLQEGQGFILKDSIGNIIIKPQKEGKQTFVLIFSNSRGEFLFPVFFSALLLLMILRFEKVYPYFSSALSKLSLGLKADEEY